MRTVNFTEEDSIAAAEEWNFNCGPGALCAVLDKTPNEIRSLMGDFEKKGYTNPTLMQECLSRAGACYKQTYRSDLPKELPFFLPEVKFGVVRIQWAGPWTEPKVPMRVRYRHTHWIAVAGNEVFDVNAMKIGGWIDFPLWAGSLVPWIVKYCVPKGTGRWWPTHAYEVERR